MASDQVLNYSFEYGDTVQVKQSAPEQYKPGAIGAICGIRTITSLKISSMFKQNIGSKIYLIEFKNGDAIEIPECFLIKH